MKKKVSTSVKILIIVIIIIALVIGILLYFHINSVSPNSCDYNNINKSYINKDPNCLINFLCIQGKMAFKDKCGCGCSTVKN